MPSSGSSTALDVPVRLIDGGTGPASLTASVISVRYIVRAQPGDLNGVEVIRRSDHSVVLRHTPAHEGRFVTTFAGLAGDRLVLLDADTSDNSVPDIGYIYDLSSGRETAVSSIRSAPTVSPFGAQGTVDSDGSWYYSAQTHGAFANCVGEINLNTLQARTVECAPGNGVIFYVNTTDTGATWDTFAAPSYSSCRTGRGSSNGRLFSVGPATDCDIFDTAVIDGWHLWSDQSRGTLQPYIPLWASDGNTATPLGLVKPQSVVVCGGYAYWKAGAATKRSHDTVIHWRPGPAQPQTILTVTAVAGSSEDDETLWLEGCNDNVLTISVHRDYLSTGNATVQLLAVQPATN